MRWSPQSALLADAAQAGAADFLAAQPPESVSNALGVDVEAVAADAATSSASSEASSGGCRIDRR